MKWCAMVLFGVSLGGIALGTIQLSTSSGNSLRPLPPDFTVLFPDIQAQRIEVVAQSNSAASWKVTAEDAAFFNEGQLTVLRGVFMHYLQRAVPLLQMTAVRGQLNNATGDITVEGTVRLTYHDSYTIETEKLSWRALYRVLYTDVPVKIHNSSVQITGQELNGDLDGHRIALRGSVQASFQLDEGVREGNLK